MRSNVGDEVRSRYGDSVIDESNAKLKGLPQEQYAEGERLRIEYEQTLKSAFEIGDPAGETSVKTPAGIIN